jgi:hypothetical protein
MALQMAQAVMHSPRPVEFVKDTKNTNPEETEQPKQNTKCHERIKLLLDELTEIMVSPECAVGQGFLSNAQGNIRAYLALFE